MTQLEQAKKNVITPEMRSVAEREPLSAEEIRDDIAAGRTVILKSELHDCAPVGIGRGLKIKINANIGTSMLQQRPGNGAREARGDRALRRGHGHGPLHGRRYPRHAADHPEGVDRFRSAPCPCTRRSCAALTWPA